MDIKQLFSHLYKHLANESILDMGREIYLYYQNPILLLDVDYNVLFQIPNQKIGDFVWDNIYDEQSITASLSSEINLKMYQDILDESSEHLYLDYGIGEKIPRLISQIKKNGEVVGYFSLLLMNNIDKDSIDYDVLSSLCDAFGLYICKISPYSTSQLEQIFIDNLLSGYYSDKEAVNKWEKRTNIKILGNFAVLSFKVGSKSNEIVYLHQMKDYVKLRLRSCYSSLVENYLYVLVTNISVGDAESGKNVIRHIVDEINDFKLKCGVSEVFSDITNLTKYKYQALRALVINNAVDTYFYSENIVYNMLSYCKTDLKVYNCINNTLDILKNYDEKNQTDYYDTLYSYLSNFKDSKKTCGDLMIHRNTLLYRIQKIEQICDISLEDNQLSLELLCDYYLLK